MPAGDASMRLSEWLRIGKLAEAVGDLGRVLRQRRITMDDWVRANTLYPSLLHIVEFSARRDLLLERMDVTEEAEEIRRGPLYQTTGPMERGASMLSSGAALYAVGHRWDQGLSPRVRAIDVSTGRVAWDADVLGGTTAPVRRRSYVARGGLLHVAHECCLAALELATGRPLWTTMLHAPLRWDSEVVEAASPMLFAVGRTLIAALPGGELCGIAGGEVRWRFSAQGATRFEEIPGIGLAISAHSDGQWTGVIEPESGALLFRHGGGELLVTSAFADGSRLWLRIHRANAGGFWSGLVAVDARTGALSTRELDAPISDAVRPVFLGGVGLWGGALPGSLVRVDASGAIQPIPLDPDMTVQQIARAGARPIVLGQHRMTGQRRLLAIDVQAAKVVWQTDDLGTAPRLSLPSLAVEDVAVLATATPDGALLSAYDASGTRRWQLEARGWMGHRFEGSLLSVTMRDRQLALTRDGAIAAEWPS